MLRRHADEMVDRFVPAQRVHDGCHLDRVGARSKDAENAKLVGASGHAAPMRDGIRA